MNRILLQEIHESTLFEELKTVNSEFSFPICLQDSGLTCRLPPLICVFKRGHTM